MDLIDLEDETIDAEVLDALAVTMDNFRVSEQEALWKITPHKRIDYIQQVMKLERTVHIVTWTVQRATIYIK